MRDSGIRFNDLYPACVARWGEPDGKHITNDGRTLWWNTGHASSPASRVQIKDMGGGSLYIAVTAEDHPGVYEWNLRASKFRPRSPLLTVEEALEGVESWHRTRNVMFPNITTMERPMNG